MHQKSKAPAHFEDKSALDHFLSARLKGLHLRSEIHGTEMPGHWSACFDAAKETSFVLIILCPILLALHSAAALMWILPIFSLGYVIWKTGRSAILGWARLERMHRLIEEERWEIEHHRLQEKSEVRAFYEAKGLTGPLLDEVIAILMADDNRLLEVMMKEELGFNLESMEHPLKQAAGATLGVAISFLILWTTLFFLPLPGTFFVAVFLIAGAAGLTARLEKNHVTPAIVWNGSVALLAASVVYFAVELIIK